MYKALREQPFRGSAASAHSPDCRQDWAVNGDCSLASCIPSKHTKRSSNSTKPVPTHTKKHCPHACLCATSHEKCLDQTLKWQSASSSCYQGVGNIIIFEMSHSQGLAPNELCWTHIYKSGPYVPPLPRHPPHTNKLPEVQDLSLS